MRAGELIRKYRTARGLEQMDLATRLRAKGSVSEIEIGRREVTAETMARFVNVLDIPSHEVAAAYTYEVGRNQSSGARNIVVMNPPRERKKKPRQPR